MHMHELSGRVCTVSCRSRRSGLKQGGALYSLHFKFALEYVKGGPRWKGVY
jgi:hypothetical protein